MTTLAAYLAHYPLSAALKAHAEGRPLPAWELHPVDVEAARPWADMLHTLRRARPAVAFPGVVKLPAATGDRYVKDGYTVTVTEPIVLAAEQIAAPDGLDEYATMADGESRTTFCPVCHQVAAPDERTANVSTVEQPAGEGERLPSGPSPANTPKAYAVDKFDRPVLPPADEGDNADPAAITALKARYAALDDDGRAWVNAIAKQAQAAGGALSLADSQPQTVRRFEAMRALVLLAEGGFADEPATRGILRAILGDVADSRLYTLGKLIAHLNQHNAARFAEYADTVTNGTAALAITQPDGHYIWEFAA